MKQNIKFFFQRNLSLNEEMQEKVVLIDFILELGKSSFDFPFKLLKGKIVFSIVKAYFLNGSHELRISKLFIEFILKVFKG